MPSICQKSTLSRYTKEENVKKLLVQTKNCHLWTLSMAQQCIDTAEEEVEDKGESHDWVDVPPVTEQPRREATTQHPSTRSPPCKGHKFWSHSIYSDARSPCPYF